MKTRLGSCSAVVLVSFVFVALTSGFVSPNNGSKLRAASQSPATEHAKKLTFADRVAYQRRIEEVYWRHRIWPKERPDPKPSLDAVMSQAELEKKVEDYLRKSQFVADQREWPITASELQAEMDRMAQHTKQPEVLREIFAALGNDPVIIAECLARPILSERLKPATAERRKGTLASLEARAPVQVTIPVAAVSANYSLPIIASPSGGCTDDILDSNKHHQCALCPRDTHRSVDGQRNDRLGRQ